MRGLSSFIIKWIILSQTTLTTPSSQKSYVGSVGSGLEGGVDMDFSEKEPICCPFCGSSDIRLCLEEWYAEPEYDNSCLEKLMEHQCEDCGMSFWTG
jgi:hypothetical protein